jgi:hypothetical protein
VSTFRQLVEQVRGTLNQYTTHRPVLATFTGWQTTDDVKTGIELAGLSNQQKIVTALVELGHELVYVANHDPVAGTTSCPPWFRQQLGSPANDDYPVNSVAVVNPQWPYHVVAQHVINGVAQLYPSLFVPKTFTIVTDTLTEHYELPDDVEEIITIRYEDDVNPAKPQREVSRWSLQPLNADGKKYLHMEQVYRSGLNVYLTYRAAPSIPAITSDSDWSDTGLPATAQDLPVLWASVQLLPSADAAKSQITSVEQSERNRFVQPGAANAASKRLQDIYDRRLAEEKRKLLDRFPPRVHRTMN